MKNLAPILCSLAVATAGMACAADNEIQALIDGAVASGAAEVVIPAGEYRITAKPKASHIVLKDIRNFTVKADGVRLICGRAARALDLANCENVKVQGLAIDYFPLLNTQGVVESVDPKAKSFVAKIADGYPNGSEFGYQVQTFDPVTRRLKVDSLQMNKATAEMIDARHIRITTDSGAAINALAVGDLVAMDREAEGPSHAVSVKDCAKVTLEDVTIHAAPSFGILESGGEGANTYRRVRITPGPTPEGAKEARLRSICDDGIHCSTSRVGPTIEDCLIERHGDDGIAIHGSYHLVLGQRGKSVDLALKRDVDFQVGDTFRFHHRDGSPAGEAKVVSIGRVNDRLDDATKEKVKELTWVLVTPNFQKKEVTIELDKEVAAESGARASSKDRMGNGFIVRGNTVREHRARGILIKASNGVIENNTVSYNTHAAIVLAPEFTWMESDFSSNVKIIGNKINGTGSEPANAARSQAGAISVVGEGWDRALAPAGSHENILIENNEITGCRGPGIIVTSTRGLTIIGNRIVSPVPALGITGEDHGIPPGVLVWIENSENVKLGDNRVENFNKPESEWLRLGRNVLHVTNEAAKAVSNP